MKLSNITSRIKSHGIGGFLKYSILKWLGIEKQQREIDSLYYYLSQYHDAKSLPRTPNSELKIMQDCDLVLLAFFDKVCRKYGLTYWLAYGTLLGAYRHSAFIPWDDDMDISMPREDMKVLFNKIKPELEALGLELRLLNGSNPRLGLTYQHEKTGIWCDIFPVDDIYVDAENEDAARQIVYETCLQFREEYKKYKYQILSKDADMLLDKYFGKFKKGKYHFVINIPEETNGVKPLINNASQIYPVSTIKMSEFDYYAPSDPCSYLAQRYSPKFRELPRDCFGHHGGGISGRLELYRWAKYNGVDMNKVKTTLENIATHY